MTTALAATLVDDAWLSGFIDGEGHFDIMPQRFARLAAAAHQPRFEVTLRDDDADVLYALRDAFGGGVKVSKLGGNDYRSKPQMRYTLGSKTGLLALVDYLDRFPPRAKKARDYAVWREGVLIYVAHGYRAPALVALSDQLRAARQYA